MPYRAALLPTIALILLCFPVAAAAAMDAEAWYEIAEELEDPVTTLGIAIDAAVVFARYFWVVLEDAWIGVSLLAVLMGGIGYTAGFFRGREMILQRMFWVMVIITLGMQPMQHTAYVDTERESVSVVGATPLKTDSGTASAGQASILIEIPTRIFMGLHRLFGSAVQDAITARGLDASHSRVAMAAGSAMNDQGVVRQLHSAKGSLPEAYRDYQQGCGALLLRDGTAGNFTTDDEMLLGLSGASMLINPSSLEQSEISESAQETMRAHSVQLGQSGATAVENMRADNVLPVDYPAYRIPSAEYWSRHFGGGTRDASAPDLLTPPDGLSGARFPPGQRMIHPDAVSSMQDLPQTPGKYWVPENCAQMYRVVQTAFNQLYAGYGANLASVAGDDGQAACAARGLEAMLARSDSLRADVTGRRAQVWAVGWLESVFDEKADCDSGGGGTSVGGGGEVAPSSALDKGALTGRAARGPMAQTQASIVSGNDSPRDSSVSQSMMDDIWGAWHAMTSELGALWDYLDARRTVPLLVGLCALGYGLVIMASPFLFAFAVLPGQTRLLTGPLRVLLYIHVLLFGLYFVLRVAGWATAELVMIISSTPDAQMMIDSPYASMLAALPLVIHIVVGFLVYVCWKIVWGGEEKGLMGGRGTQSINRDNMNMGAGVGVAAMTGPGRAARIAGAGAGAPRTPGGGAPGRGGSSKESQSPGGRQGESGSGQAGARAWPTNAGSQAQGQGQGGGASATPKSSTGGAQAAGSNGQSHESAAQQQAGSWTAAGLRSQIGKGRDTSSPSGSR